MSEAQASFAAVAAAGAASAGPCGAQPPALVQPRPPNRPQYERTLAELGEATNSLETRRKFLLDRLKIYKESQSQFRADRDSIHEQRAVVDDQLNGINKDVDTKRDQVQKLRAGLSYLNEEHIIDQVKNLEYQLRKHNFKPAEEKKIIVEIDRLNRSKKLLKEHNVLKRELDALRNTQREVREKRDQLFRQRGDVKKREDTLKRHTKELKDELDQIKEKLEELKATRTKVNNDFWAADTEYKKFLHERREREKLRRKEEREAAEAEKQRELAEIKANAEPYEEELQLIGTLITYCLRFEFPGGGSNNSSSGSSPSPQVYSTSSNGLLNVPCANPHPRRGSDQSGMKRNSLTPGSTNSSNYSTPMGVTPVSTPVEGKETNLMLYRKDNNDETLFAGVAKKSSRKNSRNERRNSRAKPLTHNPETFFQFSKFGMKPPTTTKDLVAAIEGLKEKQAYFEGLAKSVKEARLRGEVEASPPVTMILVPGAPQTVRTQSPPKDLQLKLTTTTVTGSSGSTSGATESKSCQQPAPLGAAPARGLLPAPEVMITKDGDEQQGVVVRPAPAAAAAAGNLNSEELFPSLPQPVLSNGNDLFGHMGISPKKESGSSVVESSAKAAADSLSLLTASLQKDLHLKDASDKLSSQDL